MFSYSGDLLELAIRGLIILVFGHLLVSLTYRISASIRSTILTLSLLCLLTLPLMWVSLPTWEALPQEMAIEPYFPIQMPAISQELLAEQTETSLSNASADAPPTAFWRSGKINLLLCKIWQIGLLLSVFPLILGWLILRRIERQSEPVTDLSWHALLCECEKRLGMKPNLLLLQSDQRTMPMTWGWWRPKLLIPCEANDWPKSKRQNMVLHELAHIKRRDCMFAILCQIACAMHWFNPLAWWALIRLRNIREEACDNVVLSAMDQDKASDYAQHLLDIASNLRSPAMSNHASIAMARPSKLEGRLLAILAPGSIETR